MRKISHLTTFLLLDCNSFKATFSDFSHRLRYLLPQIVVIKTVLYCGLNDLNPFNIFMQSLILLFFLPPAQCSVFTEVRSTLQRYRFYHKFIGTLKLHGYHLV